MLVTHDCTIRIPSFRFIDYVKPFFDIFFLCVFAQELKGKFLIKGKRLNKLDAAFNSNGTIEDGTVSEEDEAAESKENDQKNKSKVAEPLNTAARTLEWRNKTDLLSRLLLEIQNQTRQNALRHGRLL